MNQNVKGKESAWFIATYSDVASKFKATKGRDILFTDPEYKDTLVKVRLEVLKVDGCTDDAQDGLTRWGMPIRAVGVWDTVGQRNIFELRL